MAPKQEERLLLPGSPHNNQREETDESMQQQPSTVYTLYSAQPVPLLPQIRRMPSYLCVMSHVPCLDCLLCPLLCISLS